MSDEAFFIVGALAVVAVFLHLQANTVKATRVGDVTTRLGGGGRTSSELAAFFSTNEPAGFFAGGPTGPLINIPKSKGILPGGLF